MKAQQVKRGGFPARSGCSSTTTKNGERAGMPCITGWNVSKKRGFISFVACPNRDLYEHVSTKTGEVKAIKEGWERWTATVEQEHPNHFEKQRFTVSVFYKVKEQKLYFIDQRLVASPKGNYFGTCAPKPAQNDNYFYKGRDYEPRGDNYQKRGFQRNPNRGQELRDNKNTHTRW